MSDTTEADGREPLADVLPTLRIHPLDEGETAEEAFVLIKVRTPEGGTTWSYRTTRAPNREELLGALTIQVELLRRELLDEWDSD